MQTNLRKDVRGATIREHRTKLKKFYCSLMGESYSEDEWSRPCDGLHTYLDEAVPTPNFDDLRTNTDPHTNLDNFVIWDKIAQAEETESRFKRLQQGDGRAIQKSPTGHYLMRNNLPAAYDASGYSLQLDANNLNHLGYTYVASYR
eukprot:Platyproteum_vivax@DN746_c0_g1_i1.p1